MVGCSYLEAEVVTVWGTISNNVYYPDGSRRMIRFFEASTDGTNSSILITNVTTRLISQTGWKAGDRFYSFQLPQTNSLGTVSNVSGARVDHNQVPYLDNTFNECVWLAFASHSYFTHRTNDSASPIWPTGLRPENDDKIGTRAFYTVLKESFFPSEVAYVCDGFLHVEGVTKGILQKIPLRPPLDQGYTNYIGRAVATTNIAGVEVPLKFEVFRYGPVASGPEALSELKMLMYCVIEVNQVAIKLSGVDHPPLDKRAVVMDTRMAGTSPVRMVLHEVVSNLWPTIDQTEKKQKLLEKEFEASKQTTSASSWRKRMVWAAFAGLVVLPLIVALWKFRVTRK